ncbi:transcription factor 24-like isoform X1 [Mugil cephalus]|uniref:transcription factor 24-like isoform X1 n=1 Tax=Mugil cephalus TaxID=48193 RepID=UPI001FB81937|nr:transcription factor 24-like isoform X1 [Mugil cephalus]
MSYYNYQELKRVCYSTLSASMALTPLQGRMSVAVKHHLVSSSMVEPLSPQPPVAKSPATLYKQKQSVRSSQEPRKWKDQSVCGSRTNSDSDCGSVVQTRALRSQHSPENAARERSRVRNLRQAFHSLQAALPSVPPDTKLSKLDVLVLATNYIAYLTEALDQGGTLGEHTLPSKTAGYLHPVKKWPMRSLLYCGSVGELLSANRMPPPGQDQTHPASETDKE